MTDELNELFGEEEEANEVNAFLGEEEETGAELVGSYVRIQPSSGYPVDVPVGADEATNGLPGVPLRIVLERSGLVINFNCQFWAGQSQVDLEFLCVPGTTVTIVGNSKGG